MSLEFDGSEMITVSGWPVPSSATGIISVSWWMTPTSVASGRQRMWGSADEMEGRMGVNTGATILVTNDIFEGAGAFDSTTIFADDVLHHVVFTGDANTDTDKVYVDGVLEGTFGTATGTNVGTVLSIGGTTPTPVQMFIGTIEDWRSYDRVLSDEEVATIFAARGVDGIVNGLTARWPLNEREDGHVAVAGDIKDVGPSGLTISSVTGTPVYRPSDLRYRRRAA